MNESKWVLLYGGQGAQLPGMGRDLAEAYPAESLYENFFQEHPAYCELFDLDAETLALSRYAQPALILFDLTIWRLLKRAGLAIGASFGLSIGEFAALATAGVYPPEAILEIAVQRAQLMSQRMARRQAEGHEEGMLAILGLEAQAVSELIRKRPELTIANYNAPTQLVLSGPKSALAELATAALAGGARRAVPLEVEGAFHSPIFSPDVPELAAILSRFEARAPEIALPLNLTGDFAKIPPDQTADAYFKEIMSAQMAAPTHVDEALDRLIDAGFSHYLEISPQPVLVPLLKRKRRDLELESISDLASLEAFARKYQLRLEKEHV